MQLFVSIYSYDTLPVSNGSENVTPVGCVLKATGQPASRFLFAEESPRRFPFRWSQERSWSGSLGLVSDEGTRDVAVNPKPAINPLGPARASRTISRTDRMLSETTRLAVDFFYLLHFKFTLGVPRRTGERSNSTKHGQRIRWSGFSHNNEGNIPTEDTQHRRIENKLSQSVISLLLSELFKVSKFNNVG